MAEKADQPDDERKEADDAASGDSDGDGKSGNDKASDDKSDDDKSGGDSKSEGGEQKADKKDGEDASKDDKPKKKSLFQRPLTLAIIAIVLIVIIIAGIIFWLNARKYQSTDDAFVDAHIVRLAPQIAGRVTKVMVTDNELVGPNQPLVDIDSADVQTRVSQAQAQRAQAQAGVDDARAQIKVDQANYEQALADGRSAQAQAVNAARDLNRYLTLQRLNPAAVSQQQLDQARTQAEQTAAQRDSDLKQAKSRHEQIDAAKTQVASNTQQVRAAEATLSSAQINAGYTHIVAPIFGHVAQKSVAVGNYVQPGTQLLAIVPTDVWVTANFKENQLALIRVGQHVDLKVDACAGQKIEGHIDSIQRGAGQAFGLLPPENATGNYVKVVQRVPVKIVFDHPPKTCPLGPGMSVEPRVLVR